MSQKKLAGIIITQSDYFLRDFIGYFKACQGGKGWVSGDTPHPRLYLLYYFSVKEKVSLFQRVHTKNCNHFSRTFQGPH